MHNFRRLQRLWDTYRFPGFRPSKTVVGIFGDPSARVITLIRRSKKRAALCAAARVGDGTTERPGGSAIFPAATDASTWTWKFAASIAAGAEQ
jgi:hypothetical protein